MEDNDENNKQILDIISKTEKISCIDNRLELPPNQESLGFSLIGKLLSTRSFNGSAVQEIVSKAWNPKRTIKVTPTGKNIFIFGFELESDMQQVFYKWPWTIKGAHLILKEWCPDLAWDEVDFNWSTFWIQVHGVPRSWKSKDNLVHIGTEAGNVKEVELNEENVHLWNRFIRVRIDVEVSRPLKSGIFLPRKGLKDLWIGLKYEKLPDLCFKCGIMGHESKFCGCLPSTLSNEHGSRFLALVLG